MKMFTRDVGKKRETIVEGRANRSLYIGFWWRQTNRTIWWLIPSAVSLRRAGVEQLHQVKRMIGGIGNTFVSVQCSESQSGEKFKQTRVKGGSSHDSLKVASALNFQSDGNSNKRLFHLR